MLSFQVVSAPRRVEEKHFRSAVRNSLSKIANAVGLDALDRDDLMDLADADLVQPHWKALASKGSGGRIPEWVWNQQVRAATRSCAQAWGPI